MLNLNQPAGLRIISQTSEQQGIEVSSSSLAENALLLPELRGG